MILGDDFARTPWFHPRTSRNHCDFRIHWIITGYSFRHYGIVYIDWLRHKFNSCFLQYVREGKGIVRWHVEYIRAWH